MILNALAAAFALLSMNISIVPTPAMTVESTSVMTMAAFDAKMSQETINILIYDHAAPHWGFSQQEAMTKYDDGEITISVVVAGSVYQVNYDGGFIEVVLEQGHG
jgi:uncharacterized protein (DUF2141 family)